MIKQWGSKIYNRFIEENIELVFVDRPITGAKGLDGVSVLPCLSNVPECKMEFIYGHGARMISSMDKLKNQEEYFNYLNVFSIADNKTKDPAECIIALKEIYFQVRNNIKQMERMKLNHRILNVICCNSVSREETGILYSGLKSLTQGIVYYYKWGGVKTHRNVAVNTLICNDLMDVKSDIIYFLNPLSYHIIGECFMLMK